MKESRDVPRVVLHVGVPRSGTTYLRSALTQHAPALRDRAVLVPTDSQDAMFHAALDVRGLHKTWGRNRAEVEGTWDALCHQARHQSGTTVISHELLAAASRRQVVYALSMLTGVEVHVVVTARDLGRQLVAEWQEGILHGHRLTFAEFHARVGRLDEGVGRAFHDAQDLPEVLRRWGRDLPADRVHVVVSPTGGARSDRQALWSRFCAAAGFDPAWFPAPMDAAPPQLGVAETDLLRRVNLALDGRLREPSYGQLVSQRLGQGLLGTADPSTGTGTRPRLPARHHDSVAIVSQRWVKEIRAAGYAVHGDLDTLVPLPPDPQTPDPDVVSAARQVERAATALAELVLDLERAEERARERDAKRRSWQRQTTLLRRRLAELNG